MPLRVRLRRAARRPQLFLALAIPIALPLIVAAVRLQPESQPPANVAAASMVPMRIEYDQLQAPEAAPLPEHSEVLPIESGDTLASVLTAAGLAARDTAQLNAEIGRSVDLRRLRPGNLVRVHRNAAGEIDAVGLRIQGWGQVEALRSGDRFDVSAKPAEVREVEATVAATIETSLYEALRASGENPQLVQKLVDVFQWDIDFFSLQKGDSFTLVVSKRFAGSDLVGYGPIAAARFTHKGETVEAFRDDTSDAGGYYSRIGRPLRKQFLRAPLKFTRVTSKFTKRRFHPVLNYFRPHYGVDYGAPTGTPVMTTADGVVVSASYSRGEGNVIRVKHSSRIETSYLHLSRFAKGMKPGRKVQQGEVIGYVGATGLATGPHLDYRVREGGKWIDPLKLKSITPDPLAGKQLARFRANVTRLTTALQSQSTDVASNPSSRRALF